MNGQDRDTETGKVVTAAGEGERRAGLRPAGETASRIAAPIVARRGGGVLTRLKTQWHAVAGADLALYTWPDKLGRDGALKLRVVPGFALDLQHRTAQVIDRINIFFGREAVTRLVLVQGPLPLAGSGSPAPAVPEIGAETGMLDSRLSGIDDPELRAALAGLGELVWRVPRQPG